MIIALIILIANPQGKSESEENVSSSIISLIENDLTSGPAANPDITVSSAHQIIEKSGFQLIEISIKEAGMTGETILLTVIKDGAIIIRATDEWTVEMNTMDMPEPVQKELESRLLSD